MSQQRRVPPQGPRSPPVRALSTSEVDLRRTASAADAAAATTGGGDGEAGAPPPPPPPSHAFNKRRASSATGCGPNSAKSSGSGGNRGGAFGRLLRSCSTSSGGTRDSGGSRSTAASFLDPDGPTGDGSGSGGGEECSPPVAGRSGLSLRFGGLVAVAGAPPPPPPQTVQDRPHKQQQEEQAPRPPVAAPTASPPGPPAQPPPPSDTSPPPRSAPAPQPLAQTSPVFQPDVIQEVEHEEDEQSMAEMDTTTATSTNPQPPTYIEEDVDGDGGEEDESFNSDMDSEPSSPMITLSAASHVLPPSSAVAAGMLSREEGDEAGEDEPGDDDLMETTVRTSARKPRANSPRRARRSPVPSTEVVQPAEDAAAEPATGSGKAEEGDGSDGPDGRRKCAARDEGAEGAATGSASTAGSIGGSTSTARVIPTLPPVDEGPDISLALEILQRFADVPEDEISLSDVLDLVKSIPGDLQSVTESDLRTIHRDKQELRRTVKANYILRQDLEMLSDKIRHLVHNKLSLDEVTHTVSHLLGEQTEGLPTLPPDVKQCYGAMLFHLRRNPQYLARICAFVRAEAMDPFLRIVVFTLYGDQYDSSEERLLLQLFQFLLREEFVKGAGDISTFMRTNSILTMMLSAYARRPGSINAIKKLVGHYIVELVNDEENPLELNPSKVYTQYINDYETETGTKSTLDRNATLQEIEQVPEVRAILADRAAKVMEYAEDILNSLLEGVEEIIYGVRWLSRQLHIMASETFADSPPRQILGIVGGFFFLRFVSPVIVTPDGNGIITDKKVGKVARRNLVLVAKVLQNMSNGIPFAKKESYMGVFNPFMEARQPLMEQLFARLVQVEDLEDVLAVDRYIMDLDGEDTDTVSVTYNELSLLHTLIKDHIADVITSATDPLMRTMFLLGPAPEQVARNLNPTFNLELHSLPEGTAADGSAADDGTQPPPPAAGVLASPKSAAALTSNAGAGAGAGEEAMSPLRSPLSVRTGSVMSSGSAGSASGNGRLSSFGRPTSVGRSRALSTAVRQSQSLKMWSTERSRDEAVKGNVFAGDDELLSDAEIYRSETKRLLAHLLTNLPYDREQILTAATRATNKRVMAYITESADDDAGDGPNDGAGTAVATGADNTSLVRRHRSDFKRGVLLCDVLNAVKVLSVRDEEFERAQEAKSVLDRIDHIGHTVYNGPFALEHVSKDLATELYTALQGMIVSRSKMVRSKLRLADALESIRVQKSAFQESLLYYQRYLQNIRMEMTSGGEASAELRGSAGRQKKSKTRKGLFGRGRGNQDSLRFTHKQLVEIEVISHSDVAEGTMKHLIFTIRKHEEVAGQFEIIASIKGITAQTASVFLDDLLEEQSKGVTEIHMDQLTLNVNMLLHLLNTNFVRR